MKKFGQTAESLLTECLYYRVMFLLSFPVSQPANGMSADEWRTVTS